MSDETGEATDTGEIGSGWVRAIELVLLLGLMCVLPRLPLLDQNLALSYALFLVCVTGLALVIRGVLRGD
jgi:hypothetical protein